MAKVADRIAEVINKTDEGKVLRSFVHSASAILAIAGCAKLWSAFGDVRLLTLVDPIVGISFRHLMQAVGGAELAIAGVCLFAKAHRLAAMLVAWMATNFLVYRIGLWWIGWRKPCSCLGNLTDALHLKPEVADNIMKVILAYLLIGSYGLLFWQWRLGKATVEGGGLKRVAENIDTSPSGAMDAS